MKQKALSRDERVVQIQTAFIYDRMHGGDGSLTAVQIAHALKITASTKLRLILAEMVVQRLLVCFQEPIPGICKFRRVYALSPDNPYRVKPEYHGQGRAIRINPGRQTKQERLF